MNHFKRTVTVGQFLAASLVFLLASGCMVTPGDGEFIGAKRDPIDLAGFTSRPNRIVEIQVRKNGRWNPLGTAESGDDGIEHFGRTWYPWSTRLTVPSRFWTWQDDIHFAFPYAAELRVVDYRDGQQLYTWQPGFYDYFDPSASLGDLFNEYGGGLTATIVAIE